LKDAIFDWLAALGKILNMDSLGSGMLLWLIGVVCVRIMESPWTIFFSIVRYFMPYTMLFFSHFGLSWVMSIRVVDLFACWWTAGSTWSAGVCGRCCLHAFCGVFGGK
jgi:hypothetical protein